MKVREIMSTPVTTLEPDDNLAYAEELMTVERVRHLPVLDGEVLVGLLSHRDIVAAGSSILKTPAGDQDLEMKRKTGRIAPRPPLAKGTTKVAATATAARGAKAIASKKGMTTKVMPKASAKGTRKGAATRRTPTRRSA